MTEDPNMIDESSPTKTQAIFTQEDFYRDWPPERWPKSDSEMALCNHLLNALDVAFAGGANDHAISVAMGDELDANHGSRTAWLAHSELPAVRRGLEELTGSTFCFAPTKKATYKKMIGPEAAYALYLAAGQFLGPPPSKVARLIMSTTKPLDQRLAESLPDYCTEALDACSEGTRQNATAASFFFASGIYRTVIEIASAEGAKAGADITDQLHRRLAAVISDFRAEHGLDALTPQF